MYLAAHYGRFSTDEQDAESTVTQLRVATEWIDRERIPLVSVYKDEAESGGDPGRSDYQRMREDARHRVFNILVVDEVSRLWRDNREQWDCYEEFRYLGIDIIGVRDGIDTRREGHELLLAVRGGMNADVRRYVAKKVHDNLTSRAMEGRNAGGKAYGYRILYGQRPHRKTGKPETIPIGREINEDEAKWVRWIFEQYADGSSPRAIAHELNRLGVKSPRGKTWALTAIYGSRKKETGILNNRLYIGEYIWNRTRWIDRPMKVRNDRGLDGKRERRERPESEWIVRHIAHLQIVPHELWERVKNRQKATKYSAGPAKGAQVRTLLSGLGKCGLCGGPMVAVSKHLYGCLARKDRGTCHGVYAPRRALESVVVGAIRNDLLSQEALDELQQLVREVIRERQRTTGAVFERTRAKIADTEKHITNVTNAIAEVGMSSALRQKLAELERERISLEHEVRANDAPMIPDIVPRLIEEYRCEIDRLDDTLRENGPKARKILRELVSSVTLHKQSDGVYAELGGIYGGIFAALGGGESLNVVAGVRFHSQRLKVA